MTKIEKIGFTKYWYYPFKIEICNNNQKIIFINDIKLYPQCISLKIIELLTSGDNEKALDGILEYQKNVQKHMDRIYKMLS